MNAYLSSIAQSGKGHLVQSAAKGQVLFLARLNALDTVDGFLPTRLAISATLNPDSAIDGYSICFLVIIILLYLVDDVEARPPVTVDVLCIR